MNLLWAYNQHRACTSAVFQTALCWYDWQQKEKQAAWWMGWPGHRPRVLHRTLLGPSTMRASQAQHPFCMEIYLTWENRFLLVQFYTIKEIIHRISIVVDIIYLISSSLYYQYCPFHVNMAASDCTKTIKKHSILCHCAHSLKQNFCACFGNLSSNYLQTLSSDQITAVAMIARYLWWEVCNAELELI